MSCAAPESGMRVVRTALRALAVSAPQQRFDAGRARALGALAVTAAAG